MKTKEPLIVISIIFVFLLACQTLVARGNGIDAPTQTQETISQPTAITLSTEIPTQPVSSSDNLPSEIMDDAGVSMVLVPAGEFVMGSNDGNPDEQPSHTVNLDEYYIDKYEVTNSRYKVCVDADVCHAPRMTRSSTRDSYYGNSEFDNYPVIYVIRPWAETYCDWRGAQLPTEAQWEKAARSMDGRTYPWGEGIDETFANYNNENIDDTVEVGSFESGVSPYGAYDMAGNIAEWVGGGYTETYDQNSPLTNGDFGDFQVLRGGYWASSAVDIRTTYRRRESAGTFPEYFMGFRCARTP